MHQMARSRDQQAQCGGDDDDPSHQRLFTNAAQHSDSNLHPAATIITNYQMVLPGTRILASRKFSPRA